MPEVLFHPLRHQGLAVVQTSQRTAKHQAIETAKRSITLIPIFVDKLLHGVLRIVQLCADDLELNDTI